MTVSKPQSYTSRPIITTVYVVKWSENLLTLMTQTQKNANVTIGTNGPRVGILNK